MVIKTSRGYRITEEGGRYIKTYYPLMGARRLAEKMGVNFYTIRNYVRDHGVTAQQVPAGYITISDATAEIGVLSRASLQAKAVAHGVIKRRGKKADGKARIVMVPIWWMEEQKRKRPTEVAEELAEADWMTIGEAAKYVGLNHSTIRNALRALRGESNLRPFVMRYFENVRVVRAQSVEGRQPKYMLHPQDVEAARVMMERDARAREGLYTIAQMMQVSGMSKEAVWRRADVRKVPYERYLDEHNRVTAYFTAENVLRIVDKLPT